MTTSVLACAPLHQSNSQFLLCVAVPAQNAESTQCIPAARLADLRLHLQWNEFGMKQVERPAPVLVAALQDNFDGASDATVGFDACVAQVIEPAQNVVMPKGRVRKAQPALVDHLAGPQRAEHAALQQILFTPLASLTHNRRFTP